MINPNLQAIALQIVILALAFMVGIGLITYLLLRSARYPAPTMVTLALSLVTILSLFAYAVTREQTLVTLVGAGMGALAGAVTAQLSTPATPGGTMTDPTDETPVDAETMDAEPIVLAHDGEEFDPPDEDHHDAEAPDVILDAEDD
jgi:hypothetical protein